MPTTYRFREFEVHAVERKLFRAGDALPVGARAFDVLLSLLERDGGLVTKEELLQRAWPGLVVEEANVHVQVSQLRKLLGAGVIATVAGLGYRFASPLSGARPLPALPAESTPFVGREAALAEAALRLGQTRLLTLVGIGGTGKTRLALRLAQRESDRYADGAAWVDLAPLGSAEHLAPAVAHALGCKLHGSASAAEAIFAAVRERQLLLVLDNCEHLLDAVAALADALLAAAPGLRLLVTSREALGLPEEAVLPVRPLELPPPGAVDAEVALSEAVQLFEQRARAALPAFHLDQATSVVAAICRRVDGIPLALELAASQLKVVAPAQLLALLEEHFQLLVGPRRALPRQQTLYAVIQWSHDHLSTGEQQLLGALAVCAGGCDLEAVVALTGPQTSRASLLSGLTRLADLSLLQVRQSGSSARYQLLETVRQFALDRLQASGHSAEMRDRHAQHYLTVAEAHDREIVRAGQGAASLERLDLEHDNLMHALAWCERGDSDVAVTDALRFVAALRDYWTARGLIALGLEVTEAAVRRAHSASAATGKPRAPDRHLLWALISLAQMHRFMNDAAAALPWARRQLEVAEVLADDVGIAVGHGQLGEIARASGRLDDAETHLAASLAAAQAAQEPRRIASALHGLATLAMARGRSDEAVRRMEEVLALRRKDGHGYQLAAALISMAAFAIERDETPRARAALLEAMEMLPRIGSRYLEQHLVDLGAELMARCAAWSDAVPVCACSSAQRLAAGTPLAEEDRQQRESVLTAAREALGNEVFEAAWAAGEELDLAAAVEQVKYWLAGRR